ncbi:hypothetical protein [Gelidibacter sp.]|uniref:hypothetical protein n=1 Tax=Gelidibacter sp. TaxID=2018083 RepID=UPI00326658EF
MEKVTVYYKSEVVNYINYLVYILYKNEYFGFLESALEYKNSLIDFIEDNISTFSRKLTSLNLAHLGSFYMFYKSNKRTSWYIFFEKKVPKYLVTFISNHQAISSYFI